MNNTYKMQQRVLTVTLLVGLAFGLITLASGMSAWRLPDREQGYVPEQPINYSHRLHAGELQIDCKFCHSAAEKSRHAGIPSTDVCMKCHKKGGVTASFGKLQQSFKEDADAPADANSDAEPEPLVSKDLDLLFKEFVRLDNNLDPLPGEEPQSIPWVRVHDLPDFVYFDHRAHMAAGVSCQKCHGPVETMQRVRQHESLSMGWCVNCHRDVNKNGVDGKKTHATTGKPIHASTDCAVCHY